ncbi:MAG: HAD-IA family hydrolase [Syntrophotaleaceae bacterium]
MTAADGIIFDCDGVLFESLQANLAYYNTILRQLGEPEVTLEDAERVHLCHTAATPRVFEVLLGADRVEEALALARDLGFRQFISLMVPEPGIREVLARLSQQIPLAVATNRGNSMAELLGHFDLYRYFQTVVTSRDVKQPKPSPDMLLLASQRLGIVPERLLFVGDSELDLQAARQAGIPFAAYKKPLDGDFRIEDHEELLNLVFPPASGVL